MRQHFRDRRCVFRRPPARRLPQGSVMAAFCEATAAKGPASRRSQRSGAEHATPISKLHKARGYVWNMLWKPLYVRVSAFPLGQIVQNSNR